MSRRFSKATEKSFKYTLNKIDATSEPCGTPKIMLLIIEDADTFFTVFQICINIFQGIAINPCSECFAISKSWVCNRKLSKNPLKLHQQHIFYQDFLSILQVI